MTIGNSPAKGSDVYMWAGLSSAAKPANAFIGAKAIETNTGLVYEWDGANWCARQDGVEIDLIVKSVPTTGTFHHLGHEGMVFIYSERYNAIANTANLDILIRVPAGNTDRQVHLRFQTHSKANTGTLDVDVILYEGITVSADGTEKTIASNNDAVIKSTGVSMFSGPTIDSEPADLGNFKARGAMFGEKKSTGTQDMAVPEWVLAPSGANARDYLLRVTNNSGGPIDLIHNIFFMDSKAA